MHEPYAAQWAVIRRRQLFFWAWVFAFTIDIMLVSQARNFDTFAEGFVLWLTMPLGVMIIVSRMIWMYSSCPRCGKLFFRGDGIVPGPTTWNHCAHCGLPLWQNH